MRELPGVGPSFFVCPCGTKTKEEHGRYMRPFRLIFISPGLRATALSFVLPSDGRLRTFGRIDYRATIDTGDGRISGSFEVSLPKDNDLESAQPIDRLGPPLERFELEGKRMVAREPSFG
jgi:hypothetical protein